MNSRSKAPGTGSSLPSSSDKVRTPWTSVWAFRVSVMALIVSALTLYFTYLAPFDPLVTVGGPVFQFGAAAPENLDISLGTGPDFDPLPNRVLAFILLPVVMTHQGGMPGVISDIMLGLSRRGQTDRWLFEPRMYVDERAFVTSFEPQAHLKWIEAVFSPIALARGSQVRRFILFQGTAHPLFPGGRIRDGHYQLDVLFRIGADAEFSQVDRFNVDFGIEVLRNLEENIRFAPTPESLRPARNRLKQGWSTSRSAEP